MSKTLIVTEKPSQAKDWMAGLSSQKFITSTLAKSKTKQTVYYYESQDYIISYLAGHLVSIVDTKDMVDNAAWKLENLPYPFPSELKIGITDAGKKNLFNTIKTLAGRSDVTKIVVATDPDREGNNIWRKVQEMLPAATQKKKIYRAWPTGPTPQEWVDSLSTMKLISEYENSMLSARAREEFDFKVGVQGTVAMTAKFGGFKNVINVGRVQTVVNYFLYVREMKIKNFVPESYSTVDIEIATDEAKTAVLKFQEKTGKDVPRFSKEDAEKLLAEVQKLKDVKVDVVKKDVKVQALPLHTQSTLAMEMNKRYGMSAKETLKVSQALYNDHKLTSYPRTEQTQLTPTEAANAAKSLANSYGFESHVSKIKNKVIPDRYIYTGSDVLEHEGLHPLSSKTSKANYDALSPTEKKVYDAIVERFVAAFFPDAVKEVTTVETVVDGQTFRARGEELKVEGWMEVTGPKSATSTLPSITHGKSYDIKDIIKEDKETTPPSRYNETSLMAQMVNPTIDVTDKEDLEMLKSVKGIGTAATRATILDDIVKNGYAEKKGKSGVYHPTDKLMNLFEVMPENDLFNNASSTAKMEMNLDLIAQGKLKFDDYMSEADSRILDFINKIKALAGTTTKISNKKSYGECPRCGGELYDNGSGIACPNNNFRDKAASTCDFPVIWKNKMTDKQLKETIANAGKPAEDFGKCLGCGGNMVDKVDTVRCDSCNAKPIYKNRFGYLIPNDDIRKLIKGEEITVEGKSKAGKPYKLYLARDPKTGEQTTRPTW